MRRFMAVVVSSAFRNSLRDNRQAAVFCIVAVLCGFLRKSAASCEKIRFSNPLFSRKKRGRILPKSALTTYSQEGIVSAEINFGAEFLMTICAALTVRNIFT